MFMFPSKYFEKIKILYIKFTNLQTIVIWKNNTKKKFWHYLVDILQNHNLFSELKLEHGKYR